MSSRRRRRCHPAAAAASESEAGATLQYLCVGLRDDLLQLADLIPVSHHGDQVEIWASFATSVVDWWGMNFRTIQGELPYEEHADCQPAACWHSGTVLNRIEIVNSHLHTNKHIAHIK